MTFLQDAEQYREIKAANEAEQIRHLQEGLEYVHNHPEAHYNSEAGAGDEAFFQKVLNELGATVDKPIWQSGRKKGILVRYLSTTVSNFIVGENLENGKLRARKLFVLSNDGLEALKNKPKQG